MFTQVPDDIEGIPIRNKVAINSYRGGMHTDQGSWATPTAERLDKDKLYCTKHKTEHLFPASGGLGNLKGPFISDGYKVIYDIKDQKELDDKFQSCFEKYGSNEKAVKFFTGVQEEKQSLCRAHTQFIYSFNHTSTGRSEKYNDSYKGHKALHALLSNADLYQVHKRIHHVADPVYIKAKKLLKKQRMQEKRWSAMYESEVEKSMMLSSTKVKDVVFLTGGERVRVIETNGLEYEVNLATKIVHRGHVYVIPTCSCGYWHSSFRICLHMVRALTQAGKKVLIVYHIHPIHLIELHPLFKEACRECKRVGYDDFPHLAGAATNATISTEVSQEVVSYACPNEFFGKYGRMPTKSKQRVTKIAQLCDDIKKMVSDGGVDEFKHAHARLLQLKNELRGEKVVVQDEEMPLIQAPSEKKSAKERLADDSVNNSALCHNGSGKPGGAKEVPKKNSPAPQYEV